MRMNMKLFALINVGIALALLVAFTNGHGMILDPPGRSSRWRYNHSAPINYDDNANYCGGFNTQWNVNHGKCGLCGDNYGDPKPRANELGGKYGGAGVIVKTYKNSYTALIGFKITANHLGYITFDLCDLDVFKVESEKCFSHDSIKFADGNDRYYIDTASGWLDATIVLPPGLSCDHCVLRWTYTAGNNWGKCQNGTYAKGCGPQETFKSCADVIIVGEPNPKFHYPLLD